MSIISKSGCCEIVNLTLAYQEDLSKLRKKSIMSNVNKHKLRIGILGTGFGQTHAKIFSSFSNVEVVGIVGREDQKTEKIAHALNIQGYSDPETLINNPNVDAIVVCYPTQLHAKYVVAALNQGKDVFCETPLAFSLEEANRMAQSATENGKQLLVALFGRFVSPYKHVHEMVSSNHLGKIRTVFSNRRTPPIWGGDWDENFILNLMLHDIDYVYWLLGKPLAVTSRGLENPGGGWNHVSIMMEYENTMVTVEGCGIMPSSFPFSTSLRVVGSEAAIDLKWYWGGNMPVISMEYYPQEGQPEMLSIADYDPYEAECRYFIDCIQGKTDSKLLSIETARDSLSIALAANESLRQNGERKVVSLFS
jgi:UDP-N-acetylglucosamine 3-dehydrogenase